jgi:hypothetical protein
VQEVSLLQSRLSRIHQLQQLAEDHQQLLQASLRRGFEVAQHSRRRPLLSLKLSQCLMAVSSAVCTHIATIYNIAYLACTTRLSLVQKHCLMQEPNRFPLLNRSLFCPLFVNVMQRLTGPLPARAAAPQPARAASDKVPQVILFTRLTNMALCVLLSATAVVELLTLPVSTAQYICIYTTIIMYTTKHSFLAQTVHYYDIRV